MDFSTHFARRVKGMKPSAYVKFLNLLKNQMSFLLPVACLHPIFFLKSALPKLRKKLLTASLAGLQYGTSEGHLPLREWVAQGTKS